MTVGELGKDLLYQGLALPVRQEVQLVAEDDPRQVLNLVHEVPLLEFRYYRPRCLINSVDDHIFLSAIVISLSERFPLEIWDYVSRNFIHRYHS